MLKLCKDEYEVFADVLFVDQVYFFSGELNILSY